MPPKPIAHALGTRREEATLLAQQRILSVRAHQPAIGSGLASNFNAVGRESGNSSPPAQIYAPCRRLLHQQLVQNHAPNPKSLARRECRFHGAGIIKEANAAKGKGLVKWNRDAESLERGQSIGHDALATSFIDRRTGAQSMTVTSSPTCRAAIAAASPAGPPPATMTSRILRFAPTGSPAQKNEFGAEPRTHRGQDAVGPGRRTPPIHERIQHHQHRS